MKETMNEKDKKIFSRNKVVILSLTTVLVLLIFRLYAIQVIDNDKYLSLKEKQIKSIMDNTFHRGSIYASEGEILAISKKVSSVYVDPTLLENKENTAIKLASILSLSYSDVLAHIVGQNSGDNGSKPTKFIWIKRRISDEEAEKIKSLNIDGVRLKTEFKRMYPYNTLASHIIGFVDIDGKGLGGIEYFLNKLLAPNEILSDVIIDGRRNIISGNDTNENFFNIYLTINLALQQIVDEEIDIAQKKWHAKSISCVATNPVTGEVLAMSNIAAFDPNNPQIAPISFKKNIAITDPYEPGSSMKPFTASTALEEGICYPSMTFNCEHGTFKVGSRTIHDHKPFDILSFAEVISHSSNIGAVKIGLLVGQDKLYSYIKNFGFGEKTKIQLPGESPGRVQPANQWNLYTLTSVPIGYEITATPLQLVTAFSAIVNGGNLMKPYIISKITNTNNELIFEGKPELVRRVISKKTSDTMKEILVDVVEEGTASRAKIKGLKWGGKTGTTRKYDPLTKGYSEKKYTATFIGFAPADNPKLCIIITIDEPCGGYYGGDVSAPVVSKIINRALPLLK